MVSQATQDDGTALSIPLSALALRPTHIPSQPVPYKAHQTSLEPTTSPVKMDVTRNPTQSSGPMDVDAGSENSYDPLFDDEPEQKPAGETTLALPGVSPAKAKATTPRNSDSQPISITHRAPLFDDQLSARFSPDVYLAAYFNGEVLLWDRRTEGQVGRLPKYDKTPPSCLSVRPLSVEEHPLTVCRLVGRQMVLRSTQVVVTALSMFGTFVYLVLTWTDHLDCFAH
jgi:hypothetical protein